MHPRCCQRLEDEGRIAVSYRHSGEDYLLVEYGAPVLDLELRFRVHALMESLIRHKEPGIIDLTPGIRSLQIHYDSRTLSQSALRNLLLLAEAELPSVDKLEVRVASCICPCRGTIRPLGWRSTKYMQSVRPDAPGVRATSNSSAASNGLDSIEDVKRIVFEASYLVMGSATSISARRSRRHSIHATVS